MQIRFNDIIGELNIEREPSPFARNHLKLSYEFKNKSEQIKSWFYLDRMKEYIFGKESFIGNFMISLFVIKKLHEEKKLYYDLTQNKRFELCQELHRYFKTYLSLVYVGL